MAGALDCFGMTGQMMAGVERMMGLPRWRSKTPSRTGRHFGLRLQPSQALTGRHRP